MSENTHIGFLGSIFPHLDKEVRDVIGILLLFFLFFGGMTYLGNMDKPTKKCWDIKKIESRIFKVNKCSGEVFQLDLNKIPLANN